MRRLRASLGAALSVGLLGLAGSAAAHDYVVWLEPARLDGPGEVTVRLQVGDHLDFEVERGFEAAMVTRFERITVRGRTDLLAGREASTPPPYARVRLDAPGGAILALDRPATEITLEPAKFARYLEHEGLGDVLRERARRGEADRPGRERYSRFLKAFVQVGDRTDGVGLRPTGQTLEIVPTADPARVRVGSTLPFVLREDGQPRGGHPVDALVRAGGRTVSRRIRTDDRGRASVRLDRPGRWVLRTITMRRCAARCEAIDWESRWTSFAFHVPAPDAGR